MRPTLRWLAAGAGIAAGTYAAMVALTSARYGTVRRPAADEADVLLDRFMPHYEVVERHHLRVRAPADTAFAAACEVDLRDSRIAEAIFRARELALGGSQRSFTRRGLLTQVKELGWGVLAEIPGREIVMGAVTQPWAPNPAFRAVSPGQFAGFDEPGFVKIAWTLRADPSSPTESVVRTETRVATTDASARAAFRRYWSFVAPGAVMIRLLSLRLVKAEAERRAGGRGGSLQREIVRI